MHLTYSFLHIESNLNLLVFSKLHYGNADFLTTIRVISYRHDGTNFVVFWFKVVEDRAYVHWSDVHSLFVHVFGLKDEVRFANLAILDILLDALALPGVFEIIHRVTHKRNEAYSLAEELVMQDWSVLDDADQMWRQSWHFRDHDPSKRIRQTRITTRQSKL